jgi:hypothetical protein
MSLRQTDVPSPAMQVCEDGRIKVGAREPRWRREPVEERDSGLGPLPLRERDSVVELVKHRRGELLE